jgi:hypothetical protein
VKEGFGCYSNISGAGVDVLLLIGWPIILPLISVLFYCRKYKHLFYLLLLSTLILLAKIIYVFYRHSRDTSRFLQSNGSVDRNSYLRILALGSVDILLTLPFGIITLILLTKSVPGTSFQFYYGWEAIHSDWEPFGVPYSFFVKDGFWGMFNVYFPPWSSPALAIVVFALFGLTSEARATYWRGICAVGKIFGWAPTVHKHEDLGDMVFGALDVRQSWLQSP